MTRDRSVDLSAIREGGGGLSIRRQQLLAALLVLLAALSLVRWPIRPSAERYELGKIQPTTVIADFDFPILKDPTQLERELKQKTAAVPASVARADSALAASGRRMDALRSKVAALRRPHKDGDRNELELAFSSETLIAMLIAPRSAELIDAAERLIREVMQRGYVSNEVAGELAEYAQVTVKDPLGDATLASSALITAERLRELARERAKSKGLPADALAEIALYGAVPNLSFDRGNTEAQVQAAAAEVDRATGMVLKGEKIIGAHERITPERLRLLLSYEHWRGQKGSTAWFKRLLPALGDLLLILILLSAFFAYLWHHRRALLDQPDDLWLLTFIEMLVLVMAAVLIHFFEVPPMLVPVAAVSILVTLFFDERLGMAATVLPVFLVGLVAEGGTAFFAVVGLGSLGAVLLTPRVRQRRQFYWLLAAVPGLHLLVLFALSLTEGTPLSTFVRNALAAAGSPFLATAVALFALPILESIFHRSTDLSLLELSDLNRPLLRRLMLAAPGTYHHSIMVGALAEAAAQAVGANPLLARVTGYYHDIGKIAKPEYFAENIAIGRKNPHDKLAPSMSRLIHESHLREGVALAIESKLPREVVQGIREHHGQSVLTQYWHKARLKDPDARSDDYCYPGPRPSTVESALVLLANEVESSARSLEDPTPSRVKGVVHRVVQDNLENGNLDDSGLTLSDLAKVREVFTTLLSGAFHGRQARENPKRGDDSKTTRTDPAPLPRHRA
ncbi:MAG: HDIG domain-containing protein [Candidatus Eisenbacteria bacterium]|nr:HDIG domain-containing protein [Candidatus Eisenbacteria bacterium]